MSISEIAEEAFKESKEITFLDLVNYLKNKKVNFLLKEIKPGKLSGYVYLNKKHANKKAIIIFEDE